LELVIDPVCSVVFEAEPEEAAIMKQPPRPLHAKLFGKSVLAAGITEGLLALLAVMLVYFTFGEMGNGIDHARAVAFATLIFVNVSLILSLRSRTERIWRGLKRPNQTLYWVGAVLFVVSGAVLYVPFLAKLFHFSPPHGTDLIAAAGIAILVLTLSETAKWMISKKNLATK
jgi:Ca2+-transporting ATPase